MKREESLCDQANSPNKGKFCFCASCPDKDACDRCVEEKLRAVPVFKCRKKPDRVFDGAILCWRCRRNEIKVAGMECDECITQKERNETERSLKARRRV